FSAGVCAWAMPKAATRVARRAVRKFMVVFLGGGDESGLAYPGGRDDRAETGAVAEVNVQAGEWLEVTGVLQAAGVNHLEAHAFGECDSTLLGALDVACYEDSELLPAAEVGAAIENLGEEGVEGLDDFGTRNGLGDL